MRIEIKPTGTIAKRQCQAELIDDDDMHLASIPARYEGQGTTASPHYVVLDVSEPSLFLARPTVSGDPASGYEPAPLSRDQLIVSNRALRASRAHAWKHVEAVHELLRLVLDEMAAATVADLAVDGGVGDEEGKVWKKIEAEAERIRQALDLDEPPKLDETPKLEGQSPERDSVIAESKQRLARIIDLEDAVDELHKALAMSASIIRSGESMSRQADDRIQAALTRAGEVVSQ